MKHIYLSKNFLTLLLVNFVFGVLVSTGAPKYNIPTTVKQPDGTILKCLASGDEFHNWLHDEKGYTIIQHPKTGYYVYAIEENGQLKASDFVAGKFDPSTKGLKPYANISPKEIQKKREAYKVKRPGVDMSNLKDSKAQTSQNSNATTTMNNVVIFIKFSGDTPAAEASSYYSDIYNAATSSVYDYYLKASYNQFTVSSSFYPAPSGGNIVWYTDANSRNYYRPYNAATNTIGYNTNVTSASDPAGKTYREHTLLKNAINAVSSSITGLNLDINNDGYVDCISFIIAGENDTWNDLLWPHQWSLWSQSAFIGDRQVGDYTLQLQFFGSSTTRIDLGTLCHEMFHIVGAPDLYRYDQNATINPMGRWDIMCNTLDYPQQMTSYMKYMYGGWLSSIPQITSTGTYTLNPLQTPSGTGVNYAYQIPSPNSHTEYFVVEYRTLEGYDAGLPGTGMLVYRINSRLEGNGNADGPPDEMYVYRYNGTLTENATTFDAYFNSTIGRTAINDGSNPSSFLSDGSPGGLKISNVGNTGSTISFNAEVNFTPYVVLKHDKGAYNGIGNNSSIFSATVASRFTTTDLTTVVGRNLTKVDLYINDNCATSLNLKVWENGTYGNPGTQIYSKNILSEVKTNEWYTHTLDAPITIKANKEYWIGYSISESAGCYAVGIDRGPMVSGKGGWIFLNAQWNEIANLSASLNSNFLIRGVIASSTTDAQTNPIEQSTRITNYPNPFSTSTTFKLNLDKPGNVQLSIINILGQTVAEVTNGKFGAGEVEIPFEANGLTSGVYFFKFIFQEEGNYSNPVTETHRLIIQK